MRAFIIFITIASVFVGCSANVNLRELEISTDMLDFGAVEINKSVFKTIEVYNNTQKKLEIEYEFFNNDERDFELISDEESETVLPSETLYIEIKIRPRTIGDKSAKLKLKYNHLGSPTEIDIQAKSIKYDIQIFPYVNMIDFNYTTVNSSSLRTINLKNVGNVDATIESITFSDSSRFTIYPSNYPITLVPNQVLMMNLYFSPNKTGITEGTMGVHIDSNSTPYVTELKGTGVLPYIKEFIKKEYFNDNKLPENWSIEGVNNCWEVGNPATTTGLSAYSGNSCVGTKISNNYPDNADTRLVSPEVDLSRSITPVLTFVHWINTVYEQHGDGGFIEIRSKNQGDSENWSEWEVQEIIVPIYPVEYFNDGLHGAFAGFTMNNIWQRVSVDLSAHRGKIIQVAWHFQSDNSENSDGWFIDDVQIFEIRTNYGQ